MPTGTRARYLVLGLLLLLGGCSHQLALQSNATEMLPRQSELTAVPFYPQKAHQCAPAALATVLDYRGINLTPDDITPYVYLPKRHGSIAPEVLAYARKQGLLVYPLDGRFSSLLREIAAGNPVLVMQNLAFDWLPQWHYAVVIGYDLDARQIILRSAKERRWVTSFTAFENTWRRGNHWAYVLMPPDSLPATATPLPVLKAALDLEEVGQVTAAAQVYQSAYHAWPEEKSVLMALGNYYYGQGEFIQSVKLFARLTELQPRDTDGWNNLAYSYQQLGCRQRALNAIERAVQLAPADANLLSSRQEITESKVSADCPF